MPGRVATFVICSKTPSSNSERSFSVAKIRAGTSIPALWETGISQAVSERRTISTGTGPAPPPPDHLEVQVLRERVEGDPDPESPREGDLLLHGLPVVDLPVRDHRAAVV